MHKTISHRLYRENPHMALTFTDDIYNEVLIRIEDKVLEMTGKPLSENGMKSPSKQQSAKMAREVLRELSLRSSSNA